MLIHIFSEHFVYLFFVEIFGMFLQETRMRDRFTIYAKGGDGGSGCCSFRRSRHLRRGKPDGGSHMIALWKKSSFY